MEPHTHIKKMIDGEVNMFKEKSKMKYSSPLAKGNHPELDKTEFLDEICIQIFQSLVVSLQWFISIGLLDITTAMMTLSVVLKVKIDVCHI